MLHRSHVKQWTVFDFARLPLERNRCSRTINPIVATLLSLKIYKVHNLIELPARQILAGDVGALGTVQC